jgi:tetratricopeptide (TPR) repeat protein
VAALAALLLYAPTLRAPFLYDDLLYVRDNAFIRDPSNLASSWGVPYPPQRPEQGLYRPVTLQSFILDHLLNGLDPRGFHLTNIVLHALTTGLLTLALPALGVPPPWTLPAGLLFAAHPVHAEAVSWISGRAETLAALFVLGGLLAWVRFRRDGRRSWAVAATVLYFWGLGAKESAAPLPGVLLLGDRLGMFGPEAARRPLLSRRNLTDYLPFVGAVGLWVALRLAAIGRFGMQHAGGGPGHESHAQRVLTGLGFLADYARLLVLPLDLRVHYTDLQVRSLAEPRALLGLAVAGGLLAALIRLRRASPPTTFWLGWFLLFILPFTNILVNVGTPLAERILYIASAAGAALAGLLAAAIQRRHGRSPAVTAAVAAGLVLLPAAGLTLARNRDWVDPQRFWRREWTYNPTYRKVVHNLAALLWEEGKAAGDPARRAESLALTEEAVARKNWGDRVVTGDDVILLSAFADHLREEGRRTEAIRHYALLHQVLLRLPPLSSHAPRDHLVWWGLLLEQEGNLAEAGRVYGLAEEAEPGRAGIQVNLGNVAKRQGQTEEALERFRRATALEPALPVAALSLGVALLEQGRREEAREALARFSAAAPATADALHAQGFLWERLGEREEAVRRFRSALSRDPGHQGARSGLARLGAG